MPENPPVVKCSARAVVRKAGDDLSRAGLRHNSRDEKENAMSQPKPDKYSTNHNIKYGYVRIGIYRQTHQTNFCDLHFAGPLLSGSRLEGSYTGATKSIAQIAVGRHPYRLGIRTPKDEEKLLARDEVDERNRLQNGGRAALLLNKTSGAHECWLFGPLWFHSHNSGSLILILSGLQFPTMMTRTVANGDDIHWLEFPKGFGGSRGRCTLWGSFYTGVDRNTIDDTVPDLLKQRKHIFPIEATSVYTWRVEAYSGNLPNAEKVREQRDTTKHKYVDPEV